MSSSRSASSATLTRPTTSTLPGRLILFGVAVVLVMAPRADAARIRGGSSFNDAPVLAPGAYSDTIRLKEELFYGIELQPGQTLRAEVSVRGQKGGPEDPTVQSEVRLYTPVRQEVLTDFSPFFGTNNVSFKVGPVKVGGADARFAQGGTYFVSVHLFPGVGASNNSPIRKSVFDTRLKFNVRGRPVATPTPSPSLQTPAPSPEDSPREAAAPPPATGGDQSSDPPFAVVSLIAFLAGAIVSFLLTAGRRLARSRA